MRRQTSSMGRGWRRSLVLLALGLTVGAAAVAACGEDSFLEGDDGGDTVTLSEEAVLEYQFQDASVPPEFHRSYTMTIQQDEVHVVVDSYGDVIGETTAPVSEEVWSELVANVGELAGTESVDADCTGGTGRSLKVTDGDDVVMDFSLYPCDGEGEEDVDRLDAYVEPVIEGIPDWDSLFEPS